MARGDINSNIVGGVPDGYAGHHLIGIAEAQNFPVMEEAAELGYDINNANNGIALPTDAEESLDTGLPLHSGRHLGEYTDFVNSQLQQLQLQYDLGLVTDDNLLSSVGQVENNIRSALLNDGVRLQSTDIRPLPPTPQTPQ